MSKINRYDILGAAFAFFLTIANAVAFFNLPRFDFLFKGGLSFAWLILTLVRPKATVTDTSWKAMTAASLHTLSINMFQMEGQTLAPLAGGIFIFVGCLFAALSWISLGTSFAILPALRKLKTVGSYRLIRHPIYLGYLLISLGTTLLLFSPINLAWFVTVACLTPVRIEFEEQTLKSAGEKYENYCQMVRYKLIPGIY